MNNNSILIVEDELITAESIAALLEEEDYVIAGIARDATTALSICSNASQAPQVVICDINIKGDVQGVELAIKLKQTHGCQLIFLTAYSDPVTLKGAFAVDPVMYLVKPFNDTQLLVAVQMAFHRVMTRSALQHGQQLELTEREREVASLIAKGLSSKQIARNLHISIETVKTHRRRMLQKNNINNFPQLVYLMNLQ